MNLDKRSLSRFIFSGEAYALRDGAIKFENVVIVIPPSAIFTIS